MTNSTFSFSFNKPASASVNGAPKRMPSPSQIAFYMDLCVQKKVVPKNYTVMSYEELQQEIADLRAFYPASETQIKMIKDKITNLNTLGVAIKMPSDAEIAKLTGGREGTASALIETLITKEREMGDIACPSDAQLEFIVSMYLCPDVPFENYGVERKIILDEEKGLWRRPTPEEFAGDVKTKMKKREASKFIDDYRGVFHTWRSTRIRPQQMTYIRQLEERMMNLGSPKAQEWAIDQDGNLTQINASKSEKADNYNPKGYVSLEEMQLMMFSVEEASKYIDIMKAELNDKKLTSYGEVSDGSATFEAIREPKSEEKVRENEYKELQDLMFKLEAVAGYEDEELHNAVSTLLVDNIDVDESKMDGKIKDAKHKIRAFILHLVDEDYISIDGMATLCKESKTAQAIMMGK